jgi:hypothetical protein
MSDYEIYGVPVSLVVWGTLTLAGTVYFALDRNASRKRMLWPFFILGSTAVFAGVVLFYMFPAPSLLFFIPLLLLIGVMNFYKVRFCNACGATVGLFNGGLFPERYGHKCGSRLSR